MREKDQFLLLFLNTTGFLFKNEVRKQKYVPYPLPPKEVSSGKILVIQRIRNLGV